MRLPARPLAALLPLVVAVLPACGASAPAATPGGSDLIFADEYAADAAGPLASIAFLDGSHYSLRRSCSGPACTEAGTYAVSADASTITFTPASGTPYTYPMDATTEVDQGVGQGEVAAALAPLGVSLTSGTPVSLTSPTPVALTSATPVSLTFASAVRINGQPFKERAVLGAHDGSINLCDHFEHWGSSGPKAPTFAGSFGTMEGGEVDATPTAWWKNLDVHTVRVSVPWDIALPGSAHASDIDLPGMPSGWKAAHGAALGNEQKCLDMWLRAAHLAGATPQVAFKPDYDYRDPSHTDRIRVPDLTTYTHAVEAFSKRYSQCPAGSEAYTCKLTDPSSSTDADMDVAQVRIVSPWGEPDFHGASLAGNTLGDIDQAPQLFYLADGKSTFHEPACTSSSDDSCGPILAAHMWTAVAEACGDACSLLSGPNKGKKSSGVVAGDFSSAGGHEGGYLQTYAKHLGGVKPPTWGVHSYSDTSNYEWCKLQHESYDPESDPSESATVTFLNDLSALGYGQDTRVWLNEISVWVEDTMFKHEGSGPCHPRSCEAAECAELPDPMYSPAIQASGLSWLMTQLTAVKATRASDSPRVDRVYYMRSAATNGDAGSTSLVPGKETYETANGASKLYCAAFAYTSGGQPCPSLSASN